MTCRSTLAPIAISLFLATSWALAADIPGQKFNISVNDLPKPYATPAVDNSSHVIARPPGALPSVPPGFKIEVYASGLSNPRWMAVAPNGDVFLAEPRAGRVTLLRETDGKVQASLFADGFRTPHGLALVNDALYVGDLEAVWRVPFDSAMKAGQRMRVTSAPDLSPAGYHVTRDLAIDSKGTIYVAIGSASNVGEDGPTRATVQTVAKDGSLKPFATGLRNPVGIAFYPGTDNLFVTVNERDGLGDELVPDYLTFVKPGGFYGWPYSYLGDHPDPDWGSRRPDMVAKAIMPDLLFHAHSAPLGLVFYEGSQFPAAYKGDAFVALHGSWNSAAPTGYKVVRVPFRSGRPSGGYENFVTGFWRGADKPGAPARVWGRPAGLAVAKDGSLLIADDAGKVVWRVSYAGK
ncbi:MAG TPA: PQQ-dependent sugar dehydrogenase [Rhizomicrobium sp.]|nr:PQQ-dependent sugar dehydrogenase [Rhizomicrobium sp.]